MLVINMCGKNFFCLQSLIASGIILKIVALKMIKILLYNMIEFLKWDSKYSKV